MKRLEQKIEAILESGRSGKLLLVIGFLFFVTLQTILILDPVWKRASLPETDDSFGYLVRTAELNECPQQNCTALDDLRKQLRTPYSSDQLNWEKHNLENRIFFLFHFIFSGVLILFQKIGFNLIEAYRIVWTAAPVFFGVAIAYWLTVFWGPAAAGIALFLLSSKVFPSNGLHYVVPSNIAMAFACILLARLVSTSGKSGFFLIFGTFLLVLMHPIGRIYSIMAVLIAVAYFPGRVGKQWFPPLASVVLIGAAFLLPHLISAPHLQISSEPYGTGRTWVTGVADSLVEMFVNIARSENTLLGSLIVFIPAGVYGFFSLGIEARKRLKPLLAIYSVFLIGSLFYVLPDHPADLFLRLWIPFVILGFGAVGFAVKSCLRDSLKLYTEFSKFREKLIKPIDAVPVLLLAILLTFIFHSTLQGAESMQATIDYMMKRQPLAFDASQPKRLLEKAEVSDRVVYDDILNIVPFYFINGAMKLGAIYYPVIKSTPDESLWMERPDLRFGVFYNPLISLPGLQGNNPEKWWISLPQYRFSPISAQRKSYQIAINGQIPVAELHTLRLKIQKPCEGNKLILQLSEINQASTIEITFFSDQNSAAKRTIHRIDVEKDTNPRIEIELPNSTNELEIRFSPGSDFFVSA